MGEKELTIVPKGVILLSYGAVRKKLEELYSKGVLDRSNYYDYSVHGYHYRGVVVEQATGKKFRFHATPCIGGLEYFCFCSILGGIGPAGIYYLGSDNRIYPDDNDPRGIRRLVIDC